MTDPIIETNHTLYAVVQDGHIIDLYHDRDAARNDYDIDGTKTELWTYMLR